MNAPTPSLKEARNFLFWFFFLQLLLFLPGFFLHRPESFLLPFSGISADRFGWKEAVFLNDNHHPFRIVAEFFFLCFTALLFYRIPFVRDGIKLLVYLFYPLAFFYQVYLQGYRVVYGIHPIFIDDWILIKEVLPVFLQSAGLATAANAFFLIAGILLVVALAVGGVRQLFRALEAYRRWRWWWAPMTGLSLLTLISTLEFKEYLETDLLNIQWLSPNVARSAVATTAFHAHYRQIQSAYGPGLKCPLRKKNNVWLLFLESYGAVAYFGEGIADQQQDLALRLGDKLSNAGWHSASTYSRAPVMGGRSWLSFTSGLTGVSIDNQRSYNALLESRFRFPHMVQFFNTQGYHTTWLSTMKSNDATIQLIPEDSINAFWRYDTLLFFHKIPYQGHSYNGLGGIPDPYAGGYYKEFIRNRQKAPGFVFFITTSTHGPFYTPPPILPKWQDLNHFVPNPSQYANPLSGALLDRYGGNARYALESWVEFILKEGAPDDIFILIGDHQPGALEYLLEGKYDKYATPLHFISKDPDFIAPFIKEGLTPGLLVHPKQAPYWNHAGLYSRLVRHLLNVYGPPDCQDLRIQPDGIRNEGGVTKNDP
ncbi:MAG: hypothetical protein KIPDCIKN_03185 [Haliscomenobacter sp.]|nr:hypothetical protein [Haliscomenobacter sp.]